MNTLNRGGPARNPEHRYNSRQQFGVHRWNACKHEGGNDAIASLDQRCPAGVEPFGANRDGGSAGRCRGCRAKVGHGLCREQSRRHAVLLCQRRRAVGHAVTDDTVRPGRPQSLLRRRLPGVAEGHRQVRGPVDPRLRNTAVNSGYYTFSYTKDGETKSIPARYSLTYVKDGNDWKIVDHHSSAVPAPPK